MAGAYSLPPKVAVYRVDYRREKVPLGYDGRLHLAATTFVGIAAFVVCVSQLRDLRAPQLLAVPITYVLGNLLEYLGHQRLMHVLVKPLEFLYRRHSAEHHRHFHDLCPLGDARFRKAIAQPTRQTNRQNPRQGDGNA